MSFLGLLFSSIELFVWFLCQYSIVLITAIFI